MRIRRIWLTLLVVLMAAPAVAHEHKMDLYGAGSAESGSVLGGFHGTLNVSLKRKPPADNHPVSVFGDLSVHWGSNDRRKSNILGGLRYTIAQSHAQKHLPFVHVLLGGAENKASAGGGWNGAVGFGAGVDSIIGDDWGVRTQADYIRHGGTNTARVSVGFVKRWTN